MTASVVLFDRRTPAPDPAWRDRVLRARRHSRFVRSLRAGLLLAMAAIVGGVGFFITISAINPPPAIDPKSVVDQVRMVNPRFTGRDSSGQPYVISANSLERPESGSEVTELASPRLDFTGSVAGASIVEAARGVYDEESGTLDLLDGVHFRTNDGYSFESEHARVHVDDGRVVGDRIIMGEGPLGSIRAQSFEIRNGGDSVLFTGDVVARLYPDQPAEAAPADADDDAPSDPDAAADQTASAPDDEVETP